MGRVLFFSFSRALSDNNNNGYSTAALPGFFFFFFFRLSLSYLSTFLITLLGLVEIERK